MTLRNGIVETTTFNTRLQPIAMSTGALLTLTFGYDRDGDPTKNNGSVVSVGMDGVGGMYSQTFGYDTLNRLHWFRENGVEKQHYVYDRYGNRALLSGTQYYIPGGAKTPLVTTDDNAAEVEAQFPSNRWNGAVHDAAGNETTGDGHTLTYDAENRLTTSTLNGVTTAYAYDGDGRRVTKTTGQSAVAYVYDAGGNLAAEYATNPEPDLLCNTCYLTVDHLGSTRMMTDGSSAVALHDYLPFGEEIEAGFNGRGMLYGKPAPTQKFTGKERDAETGLDYFGARYLSGAQGRFTSPDPLTLTATRLLDPQGLNLYSYTRNRPTIAVDDGGLATVIVYVYPGARSAADVTYHSGTGVHAGGFRGLARGMHRNRFGDRGDTPYGAYKVTGYASGRLGPEYGKAKIAMEPVQSENEALVPKKHRTNLRIHGGGSVAKFVPDPYADRQPLMGTWGCVRMANADVAALWDVLDEDDDDDYVYVGTYESLAAHFRWNFRFDLSQALERDAWLRSRVAFALLWSERPSEKPKEDPESDRKPVHPRKLIWR